MAAPEESVTRWFAATLVFGSLALCAPSASCQELTPRAYWPGPNGLNILTLSYSYTDGDVLVDPAVPVEGISARTQAATASYHRFLDLWGRTGTLTLAMPYAESEFDVAAGQIATARASGAGDLQLRLGVNLLGAETMTPQEFQRFRQDPANDILGLSVKVQVPVGDFNDDRVANIGASRWSAKPELGYIRLLGSRERWALEAVLGVWFYGDNPDFTLGRLEQEPIFGPELHLIRRISPGLWISLDWNYYRGGRTTVDGEPKDNRQESSRIGLTFNYPVGHFTIKASVSDSLNVEEGGEYLGAALGFSYLWR